MKLLLLLVFATTAVLAWTRRFHPPYLKEVSWRARAEYYKIANNKTLTIAEQKQGILAWANKYKVTESVQKFFDQINKRKEKLKRDVTALINDLPEAFRNLTEVMENKDQTVSALKKALQKLRTENPVVHRVLKYAIKQVLPKQKQHWWIGTSRHGHHKHTRPFNRSPASEYEPYSGPSGNPSEQPWDETPDQPWEKPQHGPLSDANFDGWPNGGQYGGRGPYDQRGSFDGFRPNQGL